MIKRADSRVLKRSGDAVGVEKGKLPCGEAESPLFGQSLQVAPHTFGFKLVGADRYDRAARKPADRGGGMRLVYAAEPAVYEGAAAAFDAVQQFGKVFLRFQGTGEGYHLVPPFGLL